MSDDYHSVIADAVSRLPPNNDEVRHAIYELARTALQQRLGTYDPPLSDDELASEHYMLEAAISRVEEDLLLSVMRRFVAPRPAPSLSVVSRAKALVLSLGDKLK
jgi:hypothetical protein